jgi:hypothetical protein
MSNKTIFPKGYLVNLICSSLKHSPCKRKTTRKLPCGRLLLLKQIISNIKSSIRYHRKCFRSNYFNFYAVMNERLLIIKEG